MSIWKRPLKVILLTFLSYLIDVCLMPRLAVNGISGSASFAAIAVITVSYGRKAAFCSGAIIGILMETMLSSVPILYLVSYPIITMLCAQWYADLTDRQRERRKLARAGQEQPVMNGRFTAMLVKRLMSVVDVLRTMFRREENLNPYLRIPLCAMTASLIMNIVFLTYGYASGFGLDWTHLMRAAFSILYTVVIALVMTIPYRWYLGLIGRRRNRWRNEAETV